MDTTSRRITVCIVALTLLVAVCAFIGLDSRESATHLQGDESEAALTTAVRVVAPGQPAAVPAIPDARDGAAEADDEPVAPVAPGSQVVAATDDASAAERVEPRSKMSMDLLAALDSDTDSLHRIILQVQSKPGEDSTALREQVHELADELGGRVVRDIPLIGAVVVELETNSVLALAEYSSIARLSLDARVKGAMTFERAAIGADQIGTDDGTGYDGRGVVVVVIDSGVFYMHDDFQCPAEMPFLQKLSLLHDVDDIDDGLETRWDGRVKQRNNRRVVLIDFTNPLKDGKDYYGHGTHVAGIIGGSGREAWEHSGIAQHKGIAPASTILSLRVLDDDGAGYTSDVVAAISFVVANQDIIDAKVMNMSLGHPVYESYETDPLALACAAAVEAGIAVVCSAGNNGSSVDGSAYGTITSPAHAPWVITVGATNTAGTVARSDDSVASFSSRGPTAIDGMVKPDIVAPGVDIVASGLNNSTLDSAYSLMVDIGSSCNDDYMCMSGTSMAAGFVSGTLACMFQANPSLTPSAAKALLMYTAQKMTQPNVLEQGAGSLNAEGAVRLAAAIRQDSDMLPDDAFWLDADSPLDAIGMLEPYSNIGGEVAYWGSALVWGDGYLWGGGIGTGNAIVWGDGFLWDDVLNWPNGHLWYDSLIGDKQDVFGECFLWYTGCAGTSGGGVGGSSFTWGGGIGTVSGNSFLWTSQPAPGGIYGTWAGAFADPASILPESHQESVLAAGENHDPSKYQFGAPGDWFFPSKDK